MKNEYKGKVGGVVFADEVADLLTTSKQDFKHGPFKDKVFGAMSAQLNSWLKQKGCIVKSDSPPVQYSPEEQLQRELDRLLQRPEFKWLNPWALTVGPVNVPDQRGDTPSEAFEGKQEVGGTLGGESAGGKLDVPGERPGEATHPEETGNATSRLVNRRKRGLQIILESFGDDKREAWVDSSQRVVVVNEAHPVYRKFDYDTALKRYNILRAVLMALIRFGQDRRETPMSLEEGFLLFTELTTNINI